jgi:hypothetical protein
MVGNAEQPRGRTLPVVGALERLRDEVRFENRHGRS